MIYYNELIYEYGTSQYSKWITFNYYIIWYIILSDISAIPFHRMHSEITVSLPDTYKSYINTTTTTSNTTTYNNNNHNNNYHLKTDSIVDNSNVNTITLNNLHRQKQIEQSIEALHFHSGSYLHNNNNPINAYISNYANELEQYPNVWFQQRKYLTASKYQSNLWTTLDVENCYEVQPAPDLLSPEEIQQYERNLFNHNNNRRFSRQIKRKYVNYRKKFPGLKHQWFRNKRNFIKSSKRFTWLTRKPSVNYSLLRSIRSIHERKISEDQDTHLFNNTLLIDKNLKTNYTMKHHDHYHHHSVNNVVAVITVHKIAIRPSVLILKHGNVQARIHYVMQLHKELTEQYRLILEIRINPEFPPLYIGVIQNVCDYWPANVPQSKCSLKRPRFYQKNTMCFCNMPPGIYRQRVKLNLNNILHELELPRFLVSFLFSDKKLDLHITIKLEMDNKHLVGCMKVKLPLQFISA
ncbi:hypothetical protein EWB00_002752 [Schistosoma japonicum]|uniref:DUF5739 domain-containing protein n=1 Tax=Schistosoma japonicum TaxID=6182 RepID=A0A4Z2DB78_SCHJA|nr:hypothetical protein EWB00_002752 [Schistosoma japonicum]